MNPGRPPDDWYRPVASHLGGAYLRYAFARGTPAEVDFLTEELGLTAGVRLLDVGCGPGRHALEFARRGLEVVGVDISEEFTEIGRRAAAEESLAVSFFVLDARRLPFDEEFDAVVSLCEGAFSLGLDDLSILRSMAAACRPGGKVVVAAVNLFFVLTHLGEDGEFDISSMTYREDAQVLGEDGTQRTFTMYNSCYTPRELRWMANGAGLDPSAVYGVSPGAYSRTAPTADHPELLLFAEKPPES